MSNLEQEQERERFEAWATKNKMDVSCFSGFYGDRDTFMAWQAWQARCPEGWKVVPIIPIEQQVDAGCEATGDCERLGECHNDCDCSAAPKVYRAMLAAAPQPGE